MQHNLQSLKSFKTWGCRTPTCILRHGPFLFPMSFDVPITILTSQWHQVGDQSSCWLCWGFLRPVCCQCRSCWGRWTRAWQHRWRMTTKNKQINIFGYMAMIKVGHIMWRRLQYGSLLLIIFNTDHCDTMTWQLSVWKQHSLYISYPSAYSYNHVGGEGRRRKEKEGGGERRRRRRKKINQKLKM